MYIPPSSIFRKFSILLLVIFAVLALLHVDKEQVGQEALQFYGICTVGVCIYGNYFLSIVKLSPLTDASLSGAELSPSGVKISFSQKAKWAYRVLANPRGIGTEWQIRNLPLFSEAQWVPSRRRFLLTQMVACLGFYFLGDLYSRSLPFIPWQKGDLSPDKVKFFRRLGEVTIRELIVRMFFFVNMFLPQYLLYRAFHSGAAVISVLLLGDSPADWPPLFGDIREAYSIRRFWG